MILQELAELIIAGLVSGFVGALTGLGGGTLLVPILTLFLGIPTAYSAGAALISTLATSSGSASAYVRDHVTNIRIGMSLEVGTTSGSIVGSLTANYIYSHGLLWVIYVTFGSMILASILPSSSQPDLPKPKPPDFTTRILKLYGEYYDEALGMRIRYWGIRWWLSLIIMFAAGFVSGLLGIGAGVLKVLGLDWAMNLPMKVATTTSNFMIGVTAVTSSALYWRFGYIQPTIAGATALGVLLGSISGARILVRMTNTQVRQIFLPIMAFLGIEMVLRGLYPAASTYLISTALAIIITTIVLLRRSRRVQWLIGIV